MTAPTSPRALVIDLPLSRDSTAERSSLFFSQMSASLRINLLRSWDGISLQVVSNALRAAATATSTSFSVASQTEVMTSSVEGLMTSNFCLSTPSTHSLLMKLDGGRDQLEAPAGSNRRGGLWEAGASRGAYRPMGCL